VLPPGWQSPEKKSAFSAREGTFEKKVPKHRLTFGQERH
jgi:hypothetical protein